MKVSIITINYNNVSGLRRTIESVVNQTCMDYEYIIIDGGSTDGSVDYLKTFILKHFSYSEFCKIFRWNLALRNEL